jgi:hypothetical protein
MIHWSLKKWKEYTEMVIYEYSVGNPIDIYAISKGNLQISTIEQWHFLKSFIDYK